MAFLAAVIQTRPKIGLVLVVGCPNFCIPLISVKNVSSHSDDEPYFQVPSETS